MADLKIQIDGEDRASPAFAAAGAAAKKMGDDAKKGIKDAAGEAADASTKFKSLGNAMLGLGVAGAAILKFAQSSVKAFEDQARADRQLESVAGSLTETFKGQASALQASLGVSDDMVEKMQTMLLRYGEAPAAVDKTVRALLDYAAVNKIDALSATQALTSAVESGKTAFKEAGLNYEKTGLRSKDLAAATDALRLKFGGSAEKDANSLTGAANRTSEAFGELQETFGGMIGTFVQKTGALDLLNSALKNITQTLGGDAKFDRDNKWNQLDSELGEINKHIARYEADTNKFKNTYVGVQLEENRARVINAMKALEAATAAASPAALPESSALPQKTAKKIAADKAAVESAMKHAEEMRKISEQNAKMMRDAFREEENMEEHAKAFDDAKALARIEESNRLMELGEQEREALNKLAADELEINRASAEILDKQNEQIFKEQQRQLEQHENDWAEAGARIGSAFAGALSGALDQLASGGEVDAGETVGNILASVLAVAGSVIGGVLGSAVPGLGTAAGAAIGGGLGSLAGSGIKAATRRKRHDGGWAGERYHSGTWVGSDEEAAVLQSGERVLSRPEVAAMGGQSGVDAATRGRGGGVNVTVQTFDGSTAREYFERAGGRALLNAVRTGRGAPSLLFGGG